jgi:hypothetical protein
MLSRLHLLGQHPHQPAAPLNAIGPLPAQSGYFGAIFWQSWQRLPDDLSAPEHEPIAVPPLV